MIQAAERAAERSKASLRGYPLPNCASDGVESRSVLFAFQRGRLCCGRLQIGYWTINHDQLIV